jgi:hypothetical protein
MPALMLQTRPSASTDLEGYVSSKYERKRLNNYSNFFTSVAIADDQVYAFLAIKIE